MNDEKRMLRRRGGRVMEAAAALVAAMGLGLSVADAEESYPRISGDIAIEVEDDWTFKSSENNNELNDLYATIEPTLVLDVIKGLSLTAHSVFEPVRDPKPGEDRAFEDEGLYLQDLFAQYGTDRFSVLGGKFTPNFGRAWDIAPGIYGSDFAEDYEFTERIGFGGSFVFESDEIGRHRVSASTFFRDTSVLSNSIITKRGRTKLSDGGPGNTESLDSFAIAIDGDNLPLVLFGDTTPGAAPVSAFTYQVAFVSQAAGEGSDSRENGILASLADEFPIANQELRLQPLVEFAYFLDADGVDGQDRYYVTAGATAIWRENWNVALSYTRRETMPAGMPTIGDNLLQASAGYAFDAGLGANVGYRYTDVEDVQDHTLGLLLTYALEFDRALRD